MNTFVCSLLMCPLSEVSPGPRESSSPRCSPLVPSSVVAQHLQSGDERVKSHGTMEFVMSQKWLWSESASLRLLAVFSEYLVNRSAGPELIYIIFFVFPGSEQFFSLHESLWWLAIHPSATHWLAVFVMIKIHDTHFIQKTGSTIPLRRGDQNPNGFVAYTCSRTHTQTHYFVPLIVQSMAGSPCQIRNRAGS